MLSFNPSVVFQNLFPSSYIEYLGSSTSFLDNKISLAAFGCLLLVSAALASVIYLCARRFTYATAGNIAFEGQGPSTFAKVESFYIEMVRKVFQFLHSRKWDFLAAVIVTMLVEPKNTLRAAYLMQVGITNKGKLPNLNPKVLTQEQLKYAPVFLIHGDSSNCGLFGPMIDQMTADAPDRTIFTIDLYSPSGIVSVEEHLTPVLDKVKEILALFPLSARPEIICVGHSSGGDILGALIAAMGEEGLPQPKIVKIGSIFKESELETLKDYPREKILEIVGSKDIFVGDQSLLPNKLVVNTSHLSLLFKQSVLQQVSQTALQN